MVRIRVGFAFLLVLGQGFVNKKRTIIKNIDDSVVVPRKIHQSSTKSASRGDPKYDGDKN